LGGKGGDALHNWTPGKKLGGIYHPGFRSARGFGVVARWVKTHRLGKRGQK